ASAPPTIYQGWYDNVVAVDPTDPTGNTAPFGGISMLRTDDGGASFTDVAQPYAGGPLHPDAHALSFAPLDPARSLYVGTDGGVWSSQNLGGTGTSADWTNLNNGLSVTQFYSGSSVDLT